MHCKSLVQVAFKDFADDKFEAGKKNNKINGCGTNEGQGEGVTFSTYKT